MPRINRIANDTNVELSDKLLGTDSGSTTKNFTIEDISKFFSNTNAAGIAGQLTYEFKNVAPYGSGTAQGTFSSVGSLAFQHLTNLKVSVNTFGSNSSKADILATLSSKKVIISDVIDQNTFGIFNTGTIATAETDAEGNITFYNIPLTLEGSDHNGSLVNERKYAIRELSDAGDLTAVQTTTSNQLTITNGTGPIPSLAIVTGAVTNGGTALATGDQIYDFVTAGGYTLSGALTVSDDIVVSGTEPIITLTDTDTGADSQISASSIAGSLTISADFNNESNTTKIGFVTDGKEVAHFRGDSNQVGSLKLFPEKNDDTSQGIFFGTAATSANPGYLEDVHTRVISFNSSSQLYLYPTTNTAATAVPLAISSDGSIQGTSIKDEDNMASNSATHLATQQSIKAYVDSQVQTVDTLSEILALGNTTGGTKIEVDNTSGGIDFIDNAKARFGTTDKLEIYHDGTNNYITNGNVEKLYIRIGGDLHLQGRSGSGPFQDFIKGNDLAGVEIFHAGNKKLETTSSGITVTGGLTLDSVAVSAVQTSGESFADNDTSIMTSAAIDDRINAAVATKDNTDEITEGSSNLYFTNERVDDRVNSLLTAGSNITLTYDDAGNALTIAATQLTSEQVQDVIGSMLGGDETGGITVTYDDANNHIDFALSSIPNSSLANSSVTINSNSLALGGTLTLDTGDIGEGSNLYFTNERVDDRVNALITAGTGITSTYDDAAGTLTLATTITQYTDALARGAISVSGNALSYNSSTGVITSNFEETPTFTGVVTAAGLDLGDNEKIRLGASQDLEIYHDGSDSIIADTGTGGLKIQVAGTGTSGFYKYNTSEVIALFEPDGPVSLYHNNAKKIETTSTGATVTGTISATTFSGDLNGTINTATTATTQSASDNSTKVATTAYVDTAVTNLVDSSPSALDTLNELAAALGDDANFSTTVTNSIATKLPLAGGTMTGNVTFNDGAELRLGNDNDMGLFSSSGVSHIRVNEGTFELRANDLSLKNQARDETYLTAVDDGAVSIYHDNSKKFETTSAGATVTGTLVADGVQVGDDEYIELGDSQELRIYHTGSGNSVISETGGGNLFIDATNFRVRNSTAGGESMIHADADGAVELYYDNSKKIETTSAGASVTGTLAATLSTAAQPNITSLGTLTALTVDNITADGNKVQVGAISSGTLNENTGVKLAIIGDSGDNNDGLIITRDNGSQNQLDQFINIYNDGTSTFVTSGGTSTHGSFDFKSTNDKGDTSVSRLSINSSGNATFAGNVDLKSDSGNATKFLRIHNQGTAGADDAVITWQTQGSRHYSMGIHRDSGELTISSNDASVADNEMVTMALNGDMNFASNGNATRNFIFKNTDTTGTNVRTHLEATAGNRTTRLEAIHSDYNYVVGNSSRLYFQTNDASNTPLTLDGDNATFAGDVRINGNDLEFNGAAAKISGTSGGQISLNYNTTSNQPLIWYGGGTSEQFKVTNAGVATFTGKGIFNDSARVANNKYFEGTHSNGSTALRMIGIDNNGDMFMGGIDGNVGNVTIRDGSGNNTIVLASNNATFAGDAIFGGTSFEDNNSLSRKIEIAAASPVGLILNDTRDTHPMAITNDGAVMNLRYNTTAILSIDGASSASTFAGDVKLSTASKKIIADFSSGGTTRKTELELYNSSDGGFILNNEHSSTGGIKFQIDGADALSIAKSGPHATFAGDVLLGDAKKIKFGAAPDYEIYHNNTTNVNHVSSLLDRTLSINANIIQLTNEANNSTYLQLNSTGGTFAGDVIISGGHLGLSGFPRTDLHATWNQMFIGSKGSLISENGSGGIPGMTVSDNLYIDSDTGNYAYLTTNEASQLTQEAGILTFKNAASGTAGNAPTLTERFKVDASGNVTIGGSVDAASFTDIVTNTILTASGDLDIKTVLTTRDIRMYDGNNNVALRVKGDGTGAHIEGGILHLGKADTASGHINAKELMTFNIDTDNDDTNRYFAFYKNGESGSGTELMRIQEDGNVGIGTATPQKTLHIEHAAGASEGILISGASDTVGHTAGILLRAEGGESDSALRAKGGIFYEREAGDYGVGKLLLCNNASQGNTSVTVSDVALTIASDKSATFASNISTAADKRIAIGTWDNSAFTGGAAHGYYVSAATPLLILEESDQSKTGYVGVSGGNMMVGGIVSSLKFQTNDGSTRLTIDSSGDATFAGHVALADSKEVRLGAGTDFIAFHNGSNTHLQNATGDLYVENLANDKDVIFRSDDGSGGFETYFFLDGSKADGTNEYTIWPDNSIIGLGTIGDLMLYHDGSDSFVTNNTGELIITQSTNDGNININCDDGSGGVTTYMSFDGGDTDINVYKNLHLSDSVELRIGTSNDLKIYHDGSHSYIQDTGTGHLQITSSQLQINSSDNSENMATFAENGAVNLYHNGIAQAGTMSDGWQVPATKGVYFDGGAHTYIKEISADRLGIYSGGRLMLDLFENGDSSSYIDMHAPTVSIHSDVGGTTPTFQIKNTNADANPPRISLIKDSASPADNDETGRIYMYGDNDAGEQIETFLARTIFTDVSDASEDSTFEMFTYKGGTQTSTLALVSGSVGIGTTSPSSELHVKGTTTVALFEGTGGNAFLQLKDSDDSTSAFIGVDGGVLKFQTSGSSFSDKLTIDTSGFVGIGTTSVPNPFSGAYNNILQVGTTSGHTRLALTSGNDKSCDLTFADSNNASDAGSTAGVISYKHNLNSMLFSVDGSERMRIDSNGVLQLTESDSSGFVNANNTSLELDVNRHPETGSFGDANKSHARIQLAGVNGGSHIVFNTAAANNTTATERMRVASDGAVLITSDGSDGDGANLTLKHANNNTSDVIGTIYFGNNADSTLSAIVTETSGANNTSNLLFKTSTTGTLATNLTLSGGNSVFSGTLGIGITSPDAPLHIAAASSSNNAEIIRLAYTNGTKDSYNLQIKQSVTSANVRYNFCMVNNNTAHDDMLIFDQGSVYINPSSPTGTLNAASTSGTGIRFPGSANDSGVMVSVSDEATPNIAIVKHSGGSTADREFIRFVTEGSTSGEIVTGGSTSVCSYNSASDYRLKEDLKDFDGLALATKIKMYDFKWKENDTRGYGVLAHELQEVVPSAVTRNKDEEQMQGVDYSKLVPVLLKSIQELEARVKELENK